MLFGWAAHETWSGVKTIHSAYTGELQRDMVDQFVDQFQSGYELGGGHGFKAIGMGFSAVALVLTQPNLRLCRRTCERRQPKRDLQQLWPDCGHVRAHRPLCDHWESSNGR